MSTGPDSTSSPSAMSPARPLRVLMVGPGARDHALCWAMAQSPLLGELHAVPGNPGIARLATCYPEVAFDDVDAIVALAAGLDLDLAVVGAEDLLVGGLASRLQAAGVPCLGPTAEAAQLEGSKRFSKELMDQLSIPTAAWEACDDPDAARAAARRLGGAVAVKADGLAAGCGALVCHSVEEADEAVQALMVDGLFGEPTDHVIVEQLLEGSEASVMVLTDGTHTVPLPAARDYKRVGDGDAGPNTGGMGAHAPSTDVDADRTQELVRLAVQPVVDELRRRGTPFRGVIYAGFMLTPDGPHVLEYNGRLGNPETQALVRVVDGDLLDLLHRAAVGSLAGVPPLRARGAAVAVCVAAQHYPEQQLEPAPVEVSGLRGAAAVPGVEVFVGMGSERPGDAGSARVDRFTAAGGRVVTVSAHADTMEQAIDAAYEAVGMVRLDGAHYRGDIGQPALAAPVSQRA